MEEIKAVVNDYGVLLDVNPLTDSAVLDALLRELGGVRPPKHAPCRIPIHFGNGLTKEIAKTVLKRCDVEFKEI